MATTTEVPQWGRPTVYNGTQMRSRLEARFAAMLDRQGFCWKYEPECYAAGDEQYLPDFIVALPGPQKVLYVELKGRTTPEKWLQDMHRMQTCIWASDPRGVLAYSMEDPRYVRVWTQGPAMGGFFYEEDHWAWFAQVIEDLGARD